MDSNSDAIFGLPDTDLHKRYEFPPTLVLVPGTQQLPVTGYKQDEMLIHCILLA